jgi:predicted phage terminase large subunit-like protein
LTDCWSIQDDQNAKGFYQNTKLGLRQCLTVSGKGTGYRGTRQIIDDPVKVTDSYNPEALARANTWRKETMHSRLANPLTDAKVMIAQRLAENDCPGEAKNEGWTVLELASEYRKAHHCSTVTRKREDYTPQREWHDPRKAEGEPLFPAKYPKSVLDEAKSVKGMGQRAYDAQHMQDPTTSGGRIIELDWTNRRWHSPFTRPAGIALTPKLYRPLDTRSMRWHDFIIVCDATFKDVKDSDLVSNQVWGRLGPDFFLLDRVADQMGIVATIRALNDLRFKWAPRVKGCPIITLIEDKANGSAVIEVMQKDVPGIIGVEPHGGKYARISASAPWWQAGNVWLPYQEVWITEYVNNVKGYPHMRYDDDPDCMAHALAYLGPKANNASFEGLSRA